MRDETRGMLSIICSNRGAKEAPAILEWSRVLLLMTVANYIGLDVQGQEIPRPSIARQRVQEPPPTSNMKVGPLQLNVETAFRTEYVDNINASSLNPLDDFILTPEISLSAAWRATTLNTFRFRSTVGYSEYLKGSRAAQQNITISPDSALSFRLYLGDLRVDLHDRFSLLNETVDDGSLSGLSKLPRLENTAGISVTWDLNALVLQLAYNHYTFLTLDSATNADGSTVTDLSRLDHSTDQVSTLAQTRLNSAMAVGVELTASHSSYPDEPSADLSTGSAGSFFDFQVTRYTHLQVGTGVKYYSTRNGEPASTAQLSVKAAGLIEATAITLPSRNNDKRLGYYSNVTLAHRLNRYYRHRLEFGHDDNADAISGRLKTNYVKYFCDWTLGRRVTLDANGLFEDSREEAPGGIGINAPSTFRRLGFGVNVVYRASAQTSLSFQYQFIKQDSDLESESFQQNRLSFRLGYSF